MNKAALFKKFILYPAIIAVLTWLIFKSFVLAIIFYMSIISAEILEEHIRENMKLRYLLAKIFFFLGIADFFVLVFNISQIFPALKKLDTEMFYLLMICVIFAFTLMQKEWNMDSKQKKS